MGRGVGLGLLARHLFHATRVGVDLHTGRDDLRLEARAVLQRHVALQVHTCYSHRRAFYAKLIAGVEIVAKVRLARWRFFAAAAFAGENGSLKLGRVGFEGVGDLEARALGEGIAHGLLEPIGVAGEVGRLGVGQIAEELVEPEPALLGVNKDLCRAGKHFAKPIPLATGGALGGWRHAAERLDDVDNVGATIGPGTKSKLGALGFGEHVEPAGRILADSDTLKAVGIALRPRLRRGGIGQRDCGLACRCRWGYLCRTAESGLGYRVSVGRRLVHAGSLGRGRQGRRFGQAGRGCHHRRVIHGGRGRLWRGDLGGSRGGHGGDGRPGGWTQRHKGARGRVKRRIEKQHRARSRCRGCAGGRLAGARRYG